MMYGDIKRKLLNNMKIAGGLCGKDYVTGYTECIDHFMELLISNQKEIDKQKFKEIVFQSYQQGFQGALDSLKSANEHVQSRNID